MTRIKRYPRLKSKTTLGGKPVDPVSLIVAALAAGASAGISNSASSAISDAYEALKRRVRAAFANQQSGLAILEEHEKQPDLYSAPLAELLIRTNAASDPELVRAAQELLSAADQLGKEQLNFVVDARHSKGLVAGSHNIVSQRFASPTRPE